MSSIAPSKGQDYLNVLLASEISVDLMTLFHKNPGVMDSIDGLARRIGYLPDAIRSDLDAIAGLGVVTKKKLGDRDVYSLDRRKDAEIQDIINNYLLNCKLNT
jgi:hypothetical protein